MTSGQKYVKDIFFCTDAPIGRTGADGRLLVPNLRAWQSNTIALDPSDLPPDIEAGSLVAHVRPPEKSGVLAAFEVKRSKAAVVVLVDRAGKPLPVGAAARANGAESAEIGYDGETYWQDLRPENVVVVTLPARATCTARFRYQQELGTIPRIGPVRCE
jgi:outer membrane usher protein